jgi:hypothetical protein
MTDYRVILITLLAVAVLCISEAELRPHVPRDLFAEFENSYDAMNKNEELFNIPNDSEDKANNDEDETNDEKREKVAEGCNGPTGGWFC